MTSSSLIGFFPHISVQFYHLQLTNKDRREKHFLSIDCFKNVRSSTKMFLFFFCTFTKSKKKKIAISQTSKYCALVCYAFLHDFNSVFLFGTTTKENG